MHSFRESTQHKKAPLEQCRLRCLAFGVSGEARLRGLGHWSSMLLPSLLSWLQGPGASALLQPLMAINTHASPPAHWGARSFEQQDLADEEIIVSICESRFDDSKVTLPGWHFFFRFLWLLQWVRAEALRSELDYLCHGHDASFHKKAVLRFFASCSVLSCPSNISCSLPVTSRKHFAVHSWCPIIEKLYSSWNYATLLHPKLMGDIQDDNIWVMLSPCRPPMDVCSRDD